MKKLALIITDAVLLYLALVIVLMVRYGQNFSYQFDQHFLPFSLIFIIWLFVYYIANFYEISFFKNGPQFYAAFFKITFFNAALATAFFYLLPYWEIAPRRNLFLFLAVFAVLNFSARIFFNKIISSAKLKKPTLIVGLNDRSAELAQYLKANPQFGYRLEYIFDTADFRGEELSEFGIIHDTGQLERKIYEKGVNTIIISPEAYKIPRMTEIFYRLIPRKINFYPLSGFYEKISQKVLLDNLDQAWFLENLSEGSKKFYELVKRMLDIIGAIIFGIITLAMAPLITLAIKLDSAGPVFFRQIRVGQLGKPFSIIKFRTMVADAEKSSGAIWAQENDPRTTKTGKFLRKTRLDELPQIWNILKGEMSFVGPRAERPEFHNRLKSNLPFYEERYLIKPGLTGWAQTQYRYGASIKDAAEKLQYDLFYIKHRSLVLDFSIILKTVNIVIRQEGR